MGVDSLISTVANLVETIENKGGRELAAKDEFIKATGINNNQYEKVISLLDDLTSTKDNIEQYNKSIEDCDKVIGELNEGIQKLEETLTKTNSETEKARIQREIEEKRGEKNKEASRRQQLEIASSKDAIRQSSTINKLNRAGISYGNIGKAENAANKLNNTLLDSKLGGGMSDKITKFAKSPYMQAVGQFIKAVEFAIDKTTQYLRLNTENTLRLISATSTETLNKMKVSLDAWEDAVNGSYSAQESSIDSQLAMIEAQNATAMANLKMANTWSNWIPIWKQINEYGEAKLEQEQKIQEAWMKNAKEQLSMLNQYSKRIDTYNKAQDKAVHAYQAETGLSADQTKVFEGRMFQLAEKFGEFNKTIEDALKMQSRYAEVSGRAVNFSDEEYKKNFYVGRLVGEDNLINFEAQMNIFNQSVSDSADIMYDTYKDVTKMGLSQKKVVKDILGNLKLANKYDFKNGSKGFIDLAKWAENARFNLNSLGSALEKIQSGGLENTITTSAKLQVLGGPFAMLSDPLGMEFEANSDPEAYAKRIQKMFSTMGSFNNETGETAFNYAENKMIRAAAEHLGISTEDAKNMARGARQKDVVKRQMGGSTLNNDDKDAVANMAKFDKNKKQWYVDMLDGRRKNVSDVTAQDMDNIRSGNKEENAEKYAQSTLSVTEQIEATTKQINAQLGLLTIDKFKDISKKEMETVLDAYTKYQSNIGELYAQQKNDNLNDTKKTLEGIFSNILTTYEKNRTITDTNGKRMSNNEDKDAGWKFADGDRSESTVNMVKSSPKARKHLNERQIEYAYDTDTRGRFDTFIDWWTGINRKNLRWVKSDKDPQSVQLKQKQADRQNKMRSQSWDAMSMAMPDGIAYGNGSPMVVSATNVTPIQDGSVKIAKSDPKDSAIFAKTGGPFDKLFDNIFGKVNAIYDMTAQHGSTTNNHIGGDSFVSRVDNYFSKVFGSTTSNRIGGDTIQSNVLKTQPSTMNVLTDISNNGGNIKPLIKERVDEHIASAHDNLPLRDVPSDYHNEPKFSNNNQPLDVHVDGNIRGDINLKSPTGETINLSKIIESDPMLTRKITELIVCQLGSNIHGGRTEPFRNRFSTT